jgi:hypothetical protein
MFKININKNKHKRDEEKVKQYREELRGIIIDDEDELMIIYSEEMHYSCATCPLRGVCGR